MSYPDYPVITESIGNPACSMKRVIASASSSSSGKRLFFALRPDAEQRALLANRALRWSIRRGRPVPPDNIHLTLAFLGSSTAQQQQCYEQAAEAVGLRPFELTLDRVGHFARARALWIGPTEVPAELFELVRTLNRALTACGHVPEARDFNPHVTLLRKADPPPADLRPLCCRWPVKGFCLMVSESTDTGVRYRVLREYPAG